MANLSGKLIASRYLVEKLLASGGMASVYVALDTVLERPVALKVIHPHLASDRSFLDKFRREAKVAAKLSHPNLVNVYDQGQDGDITFLVMEYVPGITLRDTLNDFGLLDSARALEIIEPLTAALSAAHSAGILHRDLKPENVFLSDDGIVKLGDFGLARAISQNTQTGSVVGTVAYLSPELVLRGSADARSDIYSLGIMIFEMLTGRQPFEGDQAVQVAYQHANDEVPKPSSLNPSIPPLLDEIVLWATARQPGHRPADATALLPIISRARKDLTRGLTTNLKDIAKTERIYLEPRDLAATARVSDLQPTTAATQLLTDSDLDFEDNLSPGLEKLSRVNRRGKLLLTIFTLLAIFGSAGAGWWFSSGPGGLASIPDLQGRSLETARELLEPIGLQIEVEEENSGVVAVGSITRTDPPFGSRVQKDSTVTIFLSLGPSQVTVPVFEGLSQAQYEEKLASAGLQLGLVEYFYSNSPKDRVIGISETEGAILDQDSFVNLEVSLGSLPDLVGDELASALDELSSFDVVVNRLEVYDNKIPEGSVVALVPFRDPLPQGGQVRLEISLGPEIVTMPNVVGETIAAANTLLEGLGFKVVIDTNQLSSNFGIAKIKSQNPKPLTQLRVGDTVTIISR